MERDDSVVHADVMSVGRVARCRERRRMMVRIIMILRELNSNMELWTRKQVQEVKRQTIGREMRALAAQRSGWEAFVKAIRQAQG